MGARIGDNQRDAGGLNIWQDDPQLRHLLIIIQMLLADYLILSTGTKFLRTALLEWLICSKFSFDFPSELSPQKYILYIFLSSLDLNYLEFPSCFSIFRKFVVIGRQFLPSCQRPFWPNLTTIWFLTRHLFGQFRPDDVGREKCCAILIEVNIGPEEVSDQNLILMISTPTVFKIRNSIISKT